MRLELDAADTPLLLAAPRLVVLPGAGRGGVLRLKLGAPVRIGSEVEIEVHTGSSSELTLRDGVHVSGGARFKLRGGTIDVGAGTAVREFAILKATEGALRVGGRCTLSFGSVIHCAEAVTLGDGVGLAEHVSVLDSDHRLGGAHHPWDNPIVSDPVTLGELTTVLAGSVVLKGTRTGRGCVAAAGSVLRGDYPAASLLAGTPARVIRSLEQQGIGEADATAAAEPPREAAE